MPRNNRSGNLHAASSNGSAIIIGMNETSAVSFSVCPIIGTDSLGGCAVVAVGGLTIGIMSHADARAASVEEQMRQLVAQYTHYSAYFTAGAVAWILVARLNGEILEDNLEMMTQTVRSLGIEPRVVAYDAADRSNTRGQGSAYMEGDQHGGNWPRFYFEDREV